MPISFARLSSLMLLLLINPFALAQQPITLPRADQQALAVMLYAPAAACRGVALISPGAGGSEQGLRYLGELMAARGYLSLVLGHAESGRQALRQHRGGQGLREGLAALVTDATAYRARLADIDAAYQWARSRCATGPALLLGHSMGAATVMMVAGAHNQFGVQATSSFDAYIALSPQGVGEIFPDNAWHDIKQPVLLLTGTRDNELHGKSWQSRTEPFANLPAGCKWLGVIDGASHMNLGGRALSAPMERVLQQTINAFVAGVESGSCQPPTTPAGIQLQAK